MERILFSIDQMTASLAAGNLTLPSGWISKIAPLYQPILTEIYSNVDPNILNSASTKSRLYRFLIKANAKTKEEILKALPMCPQCNSENVLVGEHGPHQSCTKEACIKKAISIGVERSNQKTKNKFSRLSLLELTNMYNPNAKRTPQGWLPSITEMYMPFIESIWKDEGLKITKKRIRILIKYWSLRHVTTYDEAQDSIPMCKYCHQHPVIPNSVFSDVSKACHKKSCNKRYVYENTKNSVKDKYGVENISSLDSCKKAKSKALKKAYKLNGDIINAKRSVTVHDKYQVDNVSQLQEIKDKKSDTFVEHYQVDNIFKRPDLMKKYWTATLGVGNPKHVSEFNIKRIKNSVKGQIKDRGFYRMLGKKTFGFLHYLEEAITTRIYGKIKAGFLHVNETVIEKVVDGKSMGSLLDLDVASKVYIEIKSDTYFYEKGLIDRLEDLAELKNDQCLVIVIERPKYKSALFVDSNRVRTCVYFDTTKDKMIELYGNIDVFQELKTKTLYKKTFVDRVVSYCPPDAFRIGESLDNEFPELTGLL